MDTVDVPADMTRLTLDTIARSGFVYRFNSFYRDTPHPFVQAMVRVLRRGEAVLAFDLSTVVDSLKRPDNPGKATARLMRAATRAVGRSCQAPVKDERTRRCRTPR